MLYLFPVTMAKCSEILRLLFGGGWFAARQKGSHIILKHPEREDFIVFPNHGSDEIAPGTLRAIKKQAGKHYGKESKRR